MTMRVNKPQGEESKEILNRLFAEANGSKSKFIELLKQHGYVEGYNGYLDRIDHIAVYVKAPDIYAGFGFNKD